MHEKEYFYDLKWAPLDWDRKDPRVVQELVLKFLFEQADKISLTACPRRTWMKPGSFFKKGDERDPFFTKTKKSLEPFLVEKVTNHWHGREYDEAHAYEHYIYHLSPEIKAMLQETGLVWSPRKRNDLSGFDDPVFYRPNGQELARILSHRAQLIFHLSFEEKVELQKEGVTVASGEPD